MDMNPERIRPYEGRDPYIFVSYSHRDQERVEPILRALIDRGFRVWYDEGIDPGTEWPESIARHLENSRVCLAFITPFSAASANCRREINFALTKNTDLLTVFLEQTEISPGLEMQISTYQSIMGYTYPDLPSLMERIASVDVLRPCRETPAGSGAEMRVSGPRKRPGAPRRKRRAPALYFLLPAALIAAAAVLWLLLGSVREKDAVSPSGQIPAPAATSTPVPTATPQPSATPAPGTVSEPTSAPEPDVTPEETGSPEPSGDPELTEIPVTSETTEPTALPEPGPEEEEDHGYTLSYNEERDNRTDRLWQNAPVTVEDPLPEGYRTLVYGEWGYGSILIYGNDEGSVRFALTDDRLPYGYPMSEMPGPNHPNWSVTLAFSAGDRLQLSIFEADSPEAFETLEPNVNLISGEEGEGLGSFLYSITGNTFLFEADLPEPFTTGGIQTASVSIGTDQEGFADIYQFTV